MFFHQKLLHMCIRNFTYSYIYCIYGNIINKVLLTRTNYEFSLEYKPNLYSYSCYILWETIKSFQIRKKYFNNSVCNIQTQIVYLFLLLVAGKCTKTSDSESQYCAPFQHYNSLLNPNLYRSRLPDTVAVRGVLARIAWVDSFWAHSRR